MTALFDFGIQGWTWLIVSTTFALYIYIAIRTRVRSTEGFYVAGHGVPAIANGMATGADWMSAASFLSMAGLISFMGYAGCVYLLGWTGGYVLLALLLAPYLRKFGKFTVPDFVGDRYYSNTARVVAVICAIFVSFTYVSGQMRGVGIVFARFLEIKVEAGVVVGMVLVLIYAVLGGMKGITYTQVAQYVVLIVAYLVPAIALSYMYTGNPVPQLGFGSRIVSGEHAGLFLLEAIDAIHRDLGLPEYTLAWGPGKMSMTNVFCITMTLMAGTAGLPHVIIRFFTTKDVRDARYSAFWALLFIAVLYTTAPAVATFARANMIQTLHGKPYSEAPEWFKNYEKTDLIKFTDKNGDGIIQYGPDSVSELRVDKDIMVLANPEIAKLPAWTVGLVAAGGLAAALSTAAGLLLVISSAVSHDLMKRIYRPKMTDREELYWARVAAAGAVIPAGLIGIWPPAFVGEVVAYAFGLAASSFFPAIVLGIFWKRATREGAITGMLSGMGFTGLYILYFTTLGKGSGPEQWLFGINPQGIGALGMVVGFVVIVVVSLLTPPPPQEVQDAVESIRGPWGEEKPAHHH